MSQHSRSQPINAEQEEYVTLLAVQQEVGVTRGTLKKYLAYLGIEPICFHIGTRSLYISREAMARVKQLKEKPTLIVHMRPGIAPRAND